MECGNGLLDDNKMNAAETHASKLNFTIIIQFLFQFQFIASRGWGPEAMVTVSVELAFLVVRPSSQSVSPSYWGLPSWPGSVVWGPVSDSSGPSVVPHARDFRRPVLFPSSCFFPPVAKSRDSSDPVVAPSIQSRHSDHSSLHLPLTVEQLHLILLPQGQDSRP